jgi:hypothetical protein
MLLHTQTLLHRDPFTHKHLYTEMLLHTDPFAHRRFYTQTLSRMGTDIASSKSTDIIRNQLYYNLTAAAKQSGALHDII